MEIAIIGAGPVGSYAGYLLAKSGHSVAIYEKKSTIGWPIQCTGLLTADFEQFNLPLEPFLVNTFSKLEINSPQGHKQELKQKEYLVCRKKFDQYLAGLAESAGAKVYLNHAFIHKEGHQLIIKDNKKGNELKIKPDLIIAADGPLSATAKAFGLYHPLRKNYLGIQAVVKGTFEPEKYQTYFGEQLCPGMWAWVVPESSTRARVGLFSLKEPRNYFNRWLKINNFKLIEMQAGLVPQYHPQQKLQQDNCYLLGDAAGFVKASTLGGIIPGMKQAEILVDCLNHGKNYEQELKPLIRKLKLHLTVRKVLTKFSDRDWDKLIAYVAQPKVQKVFEKYTRENPVSLLVWALLKEPRFLYFGKYVF